MPFMRTTRFRSGGKLRAMPTLSEILLVPGSRPKVIADCVQVINEEVDSKGGLTGLAVKAAYALVKAVKPGFINESVDHMLDDFVSRLEPFWADAQAKNEPVGALMNGRASQVADALLAISDDRANRSKNQNLKKTYEKLRPTGKKHVEAAVPRIGRLVGKYTSAAAAAPTP
ncbi:MAG: hypothetical protein JWM82_2499 [Myxococcales bacterium]|nr:hypothetical protein [Myxococcales bacterium]